MPTINASTLRLVGLSSGMDTDSIIKNMLQIEQMKVNRQIRNKISTQWKQEQLTEINSKVKDFRDTYLVFDGSKSVTKSSTWNQYKVNTNDTSGAVTISSGGKPLYNSVSVSVRQLAEQARVDSDKLDDSISANSTVQDLLDAGYAFTTSKTDANGDPLICFEINGEYFEFGYDTTMSQIASEVNKRDIGVNMYYSELSNGFVLMSADTGSDAEITLSNSGTDADGNAQSSDFLSALGLISTGTGTQTVSGQDAICTINGIEKTMSSNSFTFDGITYSLNAVTEERDASGNLINANAINFTIDRDYDGVMDSIKDFINAYNDLITELRGYVKEKPDADYYALVDSEKEEMSEDEIAKWEEEAKKGLLFGDSDIDKMLSDMRAVFYTSIEAAGISAADIGLETGDYKQGGYIEINEDKLMAALMDNFDAVQTAFTATDGIGNQLSAVCKTYIDQVEKITLDSLDDSLKNLSDKIEKMEKRLLELEEKYYLKFAAMETALSQLNSQYDAILSFFNY